MTTSNKNQIRKDLRKVYNNKFIQAGVIEEAIYNGIIVKKSETPIMQMIAAQMSYERKLAGGR